MKACAQREMESIEETYGQSGAVDSRHGVRAATLRDGFVMWRLRRANGLSPYDYMRLLRANRVRGVMLLEDDEEIGFVLAGLCVGAVLLIDGAVPSVSALFQLLGGLRPDWRAGRIEVSPYCHRAVGAMLWKLEGGAGLARAV